MTQSSQAASGKVTKLNRVERNAWTKRRIFDAATKVVGKYGYAEASVARITEEAGVAQGTFYNHFENRQELLDQLLPKIGIDMVHFIRERTGTAHAARQEIERFSAFFEFISEVPEFLRILNEAEVFAPSGYQKHLDARASLGPSSILATRSSRPSFTCSWARAAISAGATPMPTARSPRCRGMSSPHTGNW
jgi:AcrR family transcriptional regulator